MPERAAIYARLSKDRNGLSPNCAIQTEEATDYAEERGYAIVATFQENDVSASKFSTKPRPLYNQMIDMVKRGEVDVIIATESERLLRRPDETSVLIDLAEEHPLRVDLTNGEGYDLTTSEGIYRARGAVALAERESRKLSERSKRKRRALAKQGLPVGGTRAFGYANDGMTLVPSEVAILREIGRRILSGESLASIVRDLNDRGIRTVRGNPWYRHRLNDTITRKRYVGIREHIGNEYPAAWEPVFTPEEFEAIQMELKARASGRKVVGTARRYLLTGFAFCGLCGNKLSCSSKKRSATQPLRPTYHCRKVNAQEHVIGCERITRNGRALEDLVTEAVLFRLDSDGLAQILANLDQDREVIAGLMRDVETKRLKVNDLDTDYATGLIDRSQYARMSGMAKDALQDAQEALQRAMSTKTVVSLPVGQRVREAWATWDLEQRRNVLGLLVEKVVVHPQTKRPVYRDRDGVSLGRFDPNACEIIWRA